MKKSIFTIAFLCCCIILHAQGSVGLIAHWDMNDSVNDVSGNGHNGTANNIVSAIGQDGTMGSAYYFNGINSYITVPYSPSFNITKYSICATVKVLGFYSGNCQGNVIITRGKPAAGVSGSYALLFDDNAYDTAKCGTIDSTKDVFYGNAGSLLPATAPERYYTPTISKNVWYKVVVVFNDTDYKTYVNGVLKNTAVIPTPGVANGTSGDSISIGYNIFQATTGYPFAFNGIIDDIRLYNRTLSGTEVTTYGTLETEQPNITSQQVSVYPNPANTELTIAGGSNSTLRMYNVMGQEVYHCAVTEPIHQIDIRNLANGVYFLQIIDSDGNKKSIRFLKE